MANTPGRARPDCGAAEAPLGSYGVADEGDASALSGPGGGARKLAALRVVVLPHRGTSFPVGTLHQVPLHRLALEPQHRLQRPVGPTRPLAGWLPCTAAFGALVLWWRVVERKAGEQNGLPANGGQKWAFPRFW